MSLLTEFKQFATKGNAIDLAVGVIIGGAFGKIVTSVVNDLLMPPLGMLLGKVDFRNLFLDLSGNGYPSLQAARDAGAPVIAYGLFLNTLIDFLIIALVIFLVVKQLNRLRQEPAPPPPSTRDCPYCCSAIPVAATRCPACTSTLA